MPGVISNIHLGLAPVVVFFHAELGPWWLLYWLLLGALGNLPIVWARRRVASRVSYDAPIVGEAFMAMLLTSFGPLGLIAGGALAAMIWATR